jgi:predicted transposase/invertase (TIGR01784 family)
MAYDKFWDEIISERTLIKGYFRQGHAEGHAEGLAEGMKKGEMYGLIKTARNMKIEGMEVSLIAKMTGLTEEDINRL